MNIENIKCCDLFSFESKQDKKQYVLLSFFGKKNKKLDRTKQYGKKLFTFNDCSVSFISSKINEFLEKDNLELELFSLDIGFSKNIANGIEYKKSNNSLSVKNNKKGVDFIFSKVENLKCNIVKEHKINNENNENNEDSECFSVFLGCKVIQGKEHVYVLEMKNKNKLIKRISGFKFCSENSFIEFIAKEIIKLDYLFENKIKLKVKNSKDTFEGVFRKRFIKLVSGVIIKKDKENLSKLFSKDLEKEYDDLIFKLEEYKKEITNKEKYNILYTDGSALTSKKGKKYLSGAFILSTDKGYLHGTEVKQIGYKDKTDINYAEYIALYIGVKEIIDKKLTNKKLSIIVDSDIVYDFLIELKNKKEIFMFNSVIEYKVKELLVLIDFNFDVISIKSHKKNTNENIHKHNKAVDALAYNAIVKKVNQETDLKLKRRV